MRRQIKLTDVFNILFLVAIFSSTDPVLELIPGRASLVILHTLLIFNVEYRVQTLILDATQPHFNTLFSTLNERKIVFL